ncbi:lymphocyte antigen 6 family member pge isoform X2 [Hippocampus zosterae]|uniref:lymphocyte antigen 6 family member pge isoform X2 n=1 Tax=Hippocampus zosterae TaxID=109293 RepID=UPI00223CA7EA|nr:lymphocyte antigen 6 family member pge isoform X2 [Hippocampus zosterae]
MRAVLSCLLISLCVVLLISNGMALQCYTCMGSNNEDCNRQGSRTCPSYSDACAVVVGQNSGVMKSCSYKSFCRQANSQRYRVHCCYSSDCNFTNAADRLHPLSYFLLILTWLYRCFFW